MKDLSKMTVAIQVNATEIQSLCEIVKKIKLNENNNKDEITLGISEQIVIKNIIKKITDASQRKANKLEALGSEFLNSIEFGNL